MRFDGSLILLVIVVLSATTPVRGDSFLISSASVPKVVTQPPPSDLHLTVTRNDKLAATASSTAGNVSASAFAQTDYGVLRASAYNFTGEGTSIYRYESVGFAEYWDDIYLDVPADQKMARMVFNFAATQTTVAGDPNSWEFEYFASFINSRQVDGTKTYYLGSAHCGTGPGGLGYGGSYGVLYRDLVLSGTCTLDVPVTAGGKVKLEVNSFLEVGALGYAGVSAMDATHTFRVVSTGWVNSAGDFTSAPFTGVSGTTYATAVSDEVPEFAYFGMLGAGLAVTALAARCRRRAGQST